jgi:putative RNA 2'-phosphotransferase
MVQGRNNYYIILEKENKRLSKFLSYLLRHNPGELDIALDENGWTEIDHLIEKIKARESQFNLDILKYIVDSNSKKRFSFNEDMTKIRASQGHSIEVQLNYVAKQPPVILYHGTATSNIISIKETGLQKRNRHHVHLSVDIETAVKVGQRHGKPVVLKIKSGEMFEKGFSFFLSDNGVWLTDAVPGEFIDE